MSLAVKHAAALLMLGLEPGKVEYDHMPALALRPLNADGTDTVPPANDPRYIVVRSKEGHRAKTFGPGGEKRIHTKGSDASEIAKARRLEAQRNLTGASPRKERPKRSIPSRPFPKRDRQR